MLLRTNIHFGPFWTTIGQTWNDIRPKTCSLHHTRLIFIWYRFRCCRSPGTSPRTPITQARWISRDLRNSFYTISRAWAGNLDTEMHAGSINAKWTTEHTCFDRILIERVARLYEALTGFYWDNPCNLPMGKTHSDKKSRTDIQYKTMYMYSEQTLRDHSSANLVCLTNAFFKNCLVFRHKECEHSLVFPFMFGRSHKF